MKNLFKLFLILFTTSLFSQQTGGANYQQYQNMRFNVTGSVVDSETDELLEYATVTLKNKRNPENIFPLICQVAAGLRDKLYIFGNC